MLLYALRTMRKKPAFAATAVLTLALAIGGNTAMFTVIHAVLLKPLPYPDSDRLVGISGGATPSRFAEMKASAHSFTGIGAFTGEENPTLSGGAEPEVLKGVRVSAEFPSNSRSGSAARARLSCRGRFARRPTGCDDQRRAMAAAVRGRSGDHRQDSDSCGDAVHDHWRSSAPLSISFP